MAGTSKRPAEVGGYSVGGYSDAHRVSVGGTNHT
jgi:hypothetical protein